MKYFYGHRRQDDEFVGRQIELDPRKRTGG